ncbi:hypothetical protein H7J07_06055 [Mycobacterium koreense]|uniref:Uncharacterized protein n=1 Tax=Mycolicibacillus koreensis TaxID=1069220 RepID=A0A7I7SDJ3_9MYCO|nr:hypothetical protein [Mycolicibacillus koreensis]MCV7247790.1 hypothetical protein [Mycolicibacillus koreensis]OSC34694.1 hypothetical protein B8W67_05450 [Mycolicibacillus koreensis]BBY54176.1 hypothetical protein MKOR_14270 [Mycolicibacillus koreensis]
MPDTATAEGVVLIDPNALYRPGSVPIIGADRLAQMRKVGTGPRYLQPTAGGQIWYRGRDLLEWMESGLTDPAGERRDA